jgi:indolepyruvate ferredoxin oxidoreductase beta subunit
MESLRYLPYLSKSGWVVTNSVAYNNINDYPSIERIEAEVRKLNHHIWINADDIAKECQAPKSSNIVMLGAASGLLDLEPLSLTIGIQQVFKHKGQDIIDANLRAFEAGRQFASGQK